MAATDPLIPWSPFVVLNIISFAGVFMMAKRKSDKPWLWRIVVLFIPLLSQLVLVPIHTSKTNISVLDRLNALDGKGDLSFSPA